MMDSMKEFNKALAELDAKRKEFGHPPIDQIMRIHLIEFYSHGVYTGIEMYFERLQKSRAELETETTDEIASKA